MSDIGSAFPPAPWRLRGEAWLSLWRVPTRQLPPAADGIPYLGPGGHHWVVTVLAHYAEGGTLAYQELAVAVLVRGKGLLAPSCTVLQIWVDDAAAAEGGRSLWRIPKVLGRFEAQRGPDGDLFSRVQTDGRTIASLHFHPRHRLPGRPLLGGFVIQPGPGGPLRTRCAGRAGLMLGHARWDLAGDGPLAFLEGRRPVLSVQLAGLRAAFGV